ncbi:unnamed protein product [Phytomonas sp. EM1]|nr:unnamed protein product [Phytomonas sp. EM1]|eukprot:CCW60973.1 unnamed protein product [Phytomonas sp. isolate EM1]
MAPAFLEGVAHTPSGEAACLACYLVQTKLHRPLLLNRMYREAIHRFPFQKALLVNYADFCAKHGYHHLSRKYYALAFAISGGDGCRTRCYGNYFASGHPTIDHGVVSEAIYRFYLERYPHSSEAHMMYAGYLASVMPTPFKTQRCFAKGLQLDPNSKLLSAYGFFIWACADNPAAHAGEDVQTQIFDEVEKVFEKAAQLEPNSLEALQNLGRFYAFRKNRTKEAIETFHKAHQLRPYNAEIALQLALAIENECVRLAEEERLRLGGGGAATSTANAGLQESWQSPRLRSLKEAVKQAFEKVIDLNPSHVEALDRYAKFAVSILKDLTLAAKIWSRIEQINRSQD